MPSFKSISAFEIARGVKAFLNLEAGLTRGKVPEPGDSERLRVQTQKLNQTQRQLEQRRRQLENKDNKIARLEKQLGTPESGGINPERKQVKGIKQYEEAYKFGIRHWQSRYGDPLVDRVRAHLRGRE